MRVILNYFLHLCAVTLNLLFIQYIYLIKICSLKQLCNVALVNSETFQCTLVVPHPNIPMAGTGAHAKVNVLHLFCNWCLSWAFLDKLLQMAVLKNIPALV